MSTTPYLTAGRICLTLAGVSTSVGCYIADYNETHVFNKNWPPHAKFHNGQTMSMGLLLGATTLYYTWRPAVSSLLSSPALVKDSLFSAAMIASLYWVTGLSAALYPGTKWLDPEFIGTRIDTKIWGLPPQMVVFSAHIAMAWAGYGLASLQYSPLKID